VNYPVKYFIPHIILFGAYIAVLIPLLYYYRRRNPNPRFRPSMGEMTLVAVMLLMIGGTACWFLGNMFNNEPTPGKAVPDHGAGWSKGATGGGGPDYRRD
jgi:hypothetical protein